MLSIGEFSQAAKITVKALRHYHELGLLAPELVDQETGYRYYGWKSLERARAITALKEMGFSLSEIGAIIARTSEDSELAGPLKEKLQQIEAGIREQRAMQDRIRNFLAAIESTGDTPQPGQKPCEEEVPETLLFGLRHQGRYQDVGRLISVIYRKAGRHAAGPPFCLYYDGEYKEEGADFEVCVPARGRSAIEGLDCRMFPPARAAVLVHVGPYETLGKSYSMLFDYARRLKKNIQLPIREEYLKGPGLIVRGDPACYRTKLMLMLESWAPHPR